MEEGRLVEWKKNEGDTVAAGDVLAEVETDKAVMDLVARAAGTLIKRLVAEGATVPVASLVGWIGEPGEAIPGDAAPPAAPAAAPAPAPAAHPQRAPETTTTSVPDGPDASQGEASTAPPGGPAPVSQKAYVDRAPRTPPSAAPPHDGARVKASPVARRMAAEKGVDLGRISGTGPEGRVVKRDVEQSASASATAAVQPLRLRSPTCRSARCARRCQATGAVDRTDPDFYLRRSRHGTRSRGAGRTDGAGREGKVLVQ